MTHRFSYKHSTSAEQPSLESIIEESKENYYLALRKARNTLDKDDSQLEAWLLLFLGCLKIQKDNLTQKIEREHLMQKVPDLSSQILKVVKDHRDG